MTDPVELVAKHVHALRYAERGRAVGQRVSEEDREIARDILADLGPMVREPICLDRYRNGHKVGITLYRDDECIGSCINAEEAARLAAAANHGVDGGFRVDDRYPDVEELIARGYSHAEVLGRDTVRGQIIFELAGSLAAWHSSALVEQHGRLTAKAEIERLRRQLQSVDAQPEEDR